jgi:hypothetical protein
MTTAFKDPALRSVTPLHCLGELKPIPHNHSMQKHPIRFALKLGYLLLRPMVGFGIGRT